jgi:hypothetical protein
MPARFLIWTGIFYIKRDFHTNSRGFPLKFRANLDQLSIEMSFLLVGLGLLLVGLSLLLVGLSLLLVGLVLLLVVAILLPIGFV